MDAGRQSRLGTVSQKGAGVVGLPGPLRALSFVAYTLYPVEKNAGSCIFFLHIWKDRTYRNSRSGPWTGGKPGTRQLRLSPSKNPHEV